MVIRSYMRKGGVNPPLPSFVRPKKLCVKNAIKKRPSYRGEKFFVKNAIISEIFGKIRRRTLVRGKRLCVKNAIKNFWPPPLRMYEYDIDLLCTSLCRVQVLTRNDFRVGGVSSINGKKEKNLFSLPYLSPRVPTPQNQILHPWVLCYNFCTCREEFIIYFGYSIYIGIMIGI